MMTKLADSIKHWTAQRLSIFGRVHAARSYIGSKSWYLATMIPPAPKCLKRLTAMLWRFLQTNSSMDLAVPSNRFYSPWSKAFLAQSMVRGGLNVQDYETQLSATLAKWIFKLADPRHVASWKALPFYFFEERFPGMGLSILSADPIITKSFGNEAGRWCGFLRAWLQTGFEFSKPPKDYHCILNEPLWFNRHLYYSNQNKNGRPFGKPIEDKLIKCGFVRISDLLVNTSNPDNLRFLSDDEVLARTRSTTILTDAVHKLVWDFVPLGWKVIVTQKIREPFELGDWFVEHSTATDVRPPTVYNVKTIAQSLLLGEAYSFSDTDSYVLRRCTLQAVRLLPVSQVIKA